MVLMGAEILLYPTAIGSDPADPSLDSRNHWQQVMQGHAAANMVPVVASNRIGHEQGEICNVMFYGSSFIAGPMGEIVTSIDRASEGVITASFDLDKITQMRINWGIFRDRRPDLYGTLSTLDGHISGQTHLKS